MTMLTWHSACTPRTGQVQHIKPKLSWQTLVCCNQDHHERMHVWSVAYTSTALIALTAEHYKACCCAPYQYK